MRVDQVVHRVQLVLPFLACLRGARRGRVRGDRFLPMADSREDMRRHMEGMRRSRGDFGVALGGIESLLGDGRVVVEMDQVMSDAGMPRLPLEDRLEERRALE